MNFNVIANSDLNQNRIFKLSDGLLPGIRPSLKFSGPDGLSIVVFKGSGGVQDFLSAPQVAKVFYKVEVGDFIGAYERRNGSLFLNSYKVLSIDNDSISCVHAII